MRPPTLLNVGWTTCAENAECIGVARQRYGRCLAHLTPDEREARLRELSPGECVDLRGTMITAEVLEHILSTTGGVFGRARFDQAHFLAPARFTGVTFNGDATFDRARFDGLASFFGARFTRNVSFREARFARELTMHGARVQGHASFDLVTVTNDALFGDACLSSASFQRAEFHGFTSFDGARFHGDALFRGARFWRAVSLRKSSFGGAVGLECVRFVGNAFLEPVAVARRLSLSEVRAHGKVEVNACGCLVDLRDARIMGRLVLRLGDADLDLRGLVSRGPADVTCRAGNLRVLSLDRLDVDRLSLTGADMSRCHLTGVADPERLRLTDCVFATTPRGVQVRLSWPPIRWWSDRRLLADEYAWRFGSGPQNPMTRDPGRLRRAYSGLQIDDERTASDFAFGAMEMRRLSAPRRAARLLLGAYWLLSGYGLRLGRAAAWLALIAVVAVAALLWPSTPNHPSRRPAPSHHSSQIHARR